MRHLISATLVFAALAAASPTARAFTITPIYITSIAGTFTPEQRALVTQAAADWTSSLSLGGLNNQNINVQFILESAGTDPDNSYLGQWTYLTNGGAISSPYASNITQVIKLNVDYLDQDYAGLAPPSSGSGYDMLTIFRHEMGHMLGFFPFLYSDASGDKWTRHITSDIFDPGGLDVPMLANLQHADVPTDLMYFRLPKDERRDISLTDLQMLSLAEGYITLVPEPSSLAFLLPAALALLRRRRPAY